MVTIPLLRYVGVNVALDVYMAVKWHSAIVIRK